MKEGYKTPSLTGGRLPMTSVSNPKATIAVVGASSMVASRFCDLSKNHFNLVKSDLSGKITVDITQEKSVSDFFKNYEFDWVLLFSAFTDVDEAEKQRGSKSGLCWKINVEGVKNVVAECKRNKKNLLFISTDFVFDGSDGPYDEDSPVGPDLDKVSWYGITKLAAEKLIVKNLVKYIILRISYPFRGPFRQKDDEVKRILRLYDAGNLYPLFYDQIITPTFIDDIAPAISLLFKKRARGIFHLASPRVTNQLEFAVKVLEVFGKDAGKLKKGSIVEFLKEPSTTPRPEKGGLKVNKIKELGFSPTDWEKGIETVFLQSGGKLI